MLSLKLHKKPKKNAAISGLFFSFIPIDPALFNKQHLKLFALQPAGRFIAPSFSFSSTKEHFDLLKSLGPDRAFFNLQSIQILALSFIKLLVLIFCSQMGQLILLRAKVNNTYTFAESYSVRIEAHLANQSLTWIHVQFYDDNNNIISGNAGFYILLFTEDVQNKAIDQGYELIGASLNLESSGSWLNFLLWPES